MTTPETIKSERLGFQKLQDKQGGVIPSKLEHGTVLIVETAEYMYEFTIDQVSMPTTRFVVNTASSFCRQSGTQVIGIDASNREFKLDMKDWIGKDMLMQLNYPSGTTVLTNAVMGVTIMGTNKNGKEFRYEMW